jgi:hypothetical protein
MNPNLVNMKLFIWKINTSVILMIVNKYLLISCLHLSATIINSCILYLAFEIRKDNFVITRLFSYIKQKIHNCKGLTINHEQFYISPNIMILSVNPLDIRT